MEFLSPALISTHQAVFRAISIFLQPLMWCNFIINNIVIVGKATNPFPSLHIIIKLILCFEEEGPIKEVFPLNEMNL